jgi:hypothetical protein
MRLCTFARKKIRVVRIGSDLTFIKKGYNLNIRELFNNKGVKMNGAVSIEKILESVENLDVEDQVYLLEILSKRLIDLRRLEIAKRAKEAERFYREGKVKRGKVSDLWKDLND